MLRSAVSEDAVWCSTRKYQVNILRGPVSEGAWQGCYVMQFQKMLYKMLYAAVSKMRGKVVWCAVLEGAR